LDRPCDVHSFPTRRSSDLGFVNVPQAYLNSVKVGKDAFLTVRNYSGKEFKGTITRSAGALDPATRTLRYEVDFPNKDGVLFAGRSEEHTSELQSLRHLVCR